MEKAAGGHQKFQIAGHTVWFPCKPYPSQFSMMDKILKGIERHQNCLLESPTGSGKSLALLCSALAWQSAEKDKPEPCQCRCHAAKPPTTATTTTDTAKVTCPASVPTGTSVTATGRMTAPAFPAKVGVGEEAAKQGTAVGKGGVDVSVSVSGGFAVSDRPGALQHCPVVDLTGNDQDCDEDFRPLKKFREPSKHSVGSRPKKARMCIEYEDTPPSSPCLLASTGPDNYTAAHTVDMTATPHTLTSSSSKTSSNTNTTTVTPYPSSSSPTPMHPAAPSWGREKKGQPPSTECSQCTCGDGPQKNGTRKVPKIFFGTRTHKQIAQIIRELRKTEYHSVSMTILASREHTCIHPQVSRSSSKNEGCKQLLKDAGCSFKDRMVRYQTHRALTDLGLHTAWDLEDLVHVLKKKKACPYFVSRGLKDNSDLIICPYNYLVDPLIRDSMEIKLRGQIVLLDEAHNMEDAVREAASQSISQEQVVRAIDDMDGLIEKGIKVADISKLRQMCHQLNSFIDEQSSSLTVHDFDQHYTIWTGLDIVAQLQRQGLGPQSAEPIKAAMAAVKAAEQEERQYSNTSGQNVPTLTSATWTLLEQMFLVQKYLYREDMKHAEDYRMSLVKTLQLVSVNTNGSWLSSRRHQGKKKTVEVFALNFWCMNPAVGFADFESCRSVILTSGTLSPMESFQSELGQPFPVTLEANHVIPDSQVWVGAVGRGPDGSSLKAVYQNMTSFQFQDSLGNLILRVCSTVPKGVLCFLPSYNALEKLAERWQQTGLWNKLHQHKQVMCEPRRSDSADFEEIIRSYYKTITHGDENDGEHGGIGGALFFAVCRGKVSEGLDFADDFARAVITVGIPYPNFKDIQVKLKKEYNDKARSSRRLLTGSQWYEIQAFRALNQALGRCIRHRNDWGALIIVDDRFIQNTTKYSRGLSKWVRNKLRVHPDCGAMVSSLSAFVHDRQRCVQKLMQDSLQSSQVSSSPQSAASSHLTPYPTLSTPPPLPSFPPPPPRHPFSTVRGAYHRDKRHTTSLPTRACDVDLPASATLTSPTRSSPLPPLPRLPMMPESRSPLHDVSNATTTSPTTGLNVTDPLPSTPAGPQHVTTLTITDTAQGSDVTTSITPDLQTVKEASDKVAASPVNTTTLPETPRSKTSSEEDGAASSQGPTTLLVAKPDVPQRGYPPSGCGRAAGTGVLQWSGQQGRERQTAAISVPTVTSTGGVDSLSGRQVAVDVSAASSRSLLQQQRARSVSRWGSGGPGVEKGRGVDSGVGEGVTALADHKRGDSTSSGGQGVEKGRGGGVTALADHKRGHRTSGGKDSGSTTLPTTQATAAGQGQGGSRTTPAASATSGANLDLVPASDPCQQLSSVNESQELICASSPSLFGDSPHRAPSPAGRPAFTGKPPSPSSSSVLRGEGTTISLAVSDQQKTEASAAASCQLQATGSTSVTSVTPTSVVTARRRNPMMAVASSSVPPGRSAGRAVASSSVPPGRSAGRAVASSSVPPGRSAGRAVASSSVTSPKLADTHLPDTSPAPVEQHNSEWQNMNVPGTVTRKKPLFRSASKRPADADTPHPQVTVGTGGEGQVCEVKGTSANGGVSHSTRSDVKDLGRDCSLEAGRDWSLIQVTGETGDEAEASEEEQVVRRVRTLKRRSLSLKTGSKKHRLSSERMTDLE